MGPRSPSALFATLLVVAASACQFEGPQCGPSSGVVARVLDGDTVELMSGEKIRYLMIDTPEISGEGECFGQEAKQFNSDLILGKEIQLSYDQQCTDKYDRLLAYLSIDGREINSLLVERGYACLLHIPPNGADRLEEFKRLERLAKQENKGLWGNCETDPC